MIGLPPSQAWNARKYMRATTLERPGSVEVGDDHVARPTSSTSYQIRAVVYDTPGKRTDRSSASGAIAGTRAVLGFAEFAVDVARELEGELLVGDLVHWQGEVFQVSTRSRWASGAAMHAAEQNSQTFFEFTANRIVRRA